MTWRRARGRAIGYHEGVRTAVLALCLAPATLSVSASAQPQPRTCATMAQLQLTRLGLANADVGVAERPTTEAGFVDSADWPVRVHYATAEDQPRAELLLAEVEDAWLREVEVAGFPPPLSDDGRGGSDAFDVYLAPVGPGATALTVAEDDAAPDDGRRASPSFIKVDPTLSDDELAIVAAHELSHALQFAIDTQESVMWFESTATFFEVLLHPEVTLWHDPLPAFQGEPQAPVYTDGAAFFLYRTVDDARYEYGAVLWALYLEEVHGAFDGALLRELWQGSTQADDVEGNEPDWLDALAARGDDPGALIADFIGWRALVGNLAVAGDGPREPIPPSAALRVGVAFAEALDGREITTRDVEGPFALGCVVREVAAPPAAPLPIHAEATGTVDGQELALSTLLLDKGADDETIGAVRAVEDRGAAVATDVELPAGDLVQIAFCDVTADADADAEPAPRPIRFRLLRTDIDFPDAGFADPDAGVAGDVDAGPPPPMCDCQGTPSPTGRAGRSPLYALGVLVTMVGLFLKGWRARRRKQLYRRDDERR